MEVAVFVIAVLFSIGLLFTMVYFSIMFSDLESDFINPIDFCAQMNKFVLPEFMAHSFLTLLFLITLQPTAILWNLPLLAYHAHRVINQQHWYDPTEIFRRQLKYSKMESVTKMVFYLLSFFYYLYRMIWAMMAGK